MAMRRRFLDRGSFTTTLKGRQDYLTEVDGEIESLVKARLSAAFPGDGFIGEEGGGAPADDLWVADPIDGTANFARGIPRYCISLAFMRQGHISAGVIFDPMHNELFAAMAGGGAFLDGVPMRVAATTKMARATIECGWNLRLPIEDYHGMIARVAATGAGVSRFGSGALGMAYVAAGRTDGYCENHINAWDVLAGMLLVQEAGGRVSDFLKSDGLTKGNPIIAAAPGIADALARASGIAW